MHYKESSSIDFIAFTTLIYAGVAQKALLMSDPQSGGNRAISPPKFFKACLFVKYNNKLQSL